MRTTNQTGYKTYKELMFIRSVSLNAIADSLGRATVWTSELDEAVAENISADNDVLRMMKKGNL